jgi:DeoR/GlpR family transcriptional regulator of sugar metabolism
VIDIKTFVPTYFDKFRCIADKCPDTCCAGWEADLDGEIIAKYKTLDGELGEKIKNSLAEKACELINDGETVFIDGSTTTEAMGKYLIQKKDITVITNNIALVLFLNEHNIDVVNLGGRIIESPYILGGDDAEENAMKYKADKMFFSSSGMTAAGEIQADPEYETLRRIMHKNSSESYYLVDREKILKSIKKVLFTPEDINGVISDYIHLNKKKALYPNTKFIQVENFTP